MALKIELEQWQAACTAFDNKDYDGSIKGFIAIADNAKMHFNIGLIYAAVEDHDHAIKAYSIALSMDPYLAVAYFQRGVSYFIMCDMEAARNDFDQAFEKLRGNQIINYQQLGLSFRLYSCEVLFNRGICLLNLMKIDAGLTDLYHAQKARMTEEHDVINQAVKDRGKGYSVFSIPPGVIFKPSENRLKQLQGTDMFSMANQLCKKNKQPIQRNNSILLSELNKKVPASSSNLLYGTKHDKHDTRRPQQSAPTERRRKDSNFGLYTSDDSASIKSTASSLYRQKQEPKRVDSGFESAVDERYSSYSASTTSTLSMLGGSGNRSSSRMQKCAIVTPPVPPLPTYQVEDSPTSFYGDFDKELDDVYGSMHTLTVNDRERDFIKTRLTHGNHSNNSLIYNSDMQTSTSTSTNGSTTSLGQSKLKVKVYYKDTRILLLPSNVTFDELRMKIKEKFSTSASLRLQYKDEDNGKVLMIDDDDLFMARQINKEHHHTMDHGGIEKLEIWCTS